MCDVTAQTHYTYAMQRCLKQANKDNAAKQNSQMEGDSGIGTTLHDKLRESFSNFSVSRRSSACSSHCPSTYLSIPASSGADTAPSSSAYSSAASSCCEAESARLKPVVEASEVSKHPKFNNNNNSSVLPVQQCQGDLIHRDTTGCLSQKLTRSHTVQHRRTRKTSSASSTKSDHFLADESRRLVDASTDSVYEKKRLLGKVRFALELKIDSVCTAHWYRSSTRT